ncbi:MAG: hypothetical protein M3383_00050 [Actinomycetota bacterium]|nr:hypothetical protein [Actinomycetota bacterium]
MPEIIVTAQPGEGGEAPVVMRERVTESALQSGHYAEQLIERIGWAVVDASEAQGREGSEPAHQVSEPAHQG